MREATGVLLEGSRMFWYTVLCVFVFVLYSTNGQTTTDTTTSPPFTALPVFSTNFATLSLPTVLSFSDPTTSSILQTVIVNVKISVKALSSSTDASIQADLLDAAVQLELYLKTNYKDIQSLRITKIKKD